MNENKKKFPIKIVAATAVITLIIAGGIAGMLGWFGPKDGTGTSEVHEHSKKELWTCGMHPWILEEEPGDCPICAMKLTPKRDTEETATTTGERQIAYWRAPMNPMEIYDKPGKSAMGMDLVPVYEDEIIGGVEVKIDPATQQNMGLRLAAVEQAPLTRTIRTYGHVTYDETRTAFVSPKFSGWFEKLHVDFTGQLVEKGQPLYEIYSPDLVAAQEEYLTAYRTLRRSPGNANRDFLESTKRRLSYFDVADSEIRAIEAADSTKKTIVIRSPFTGVVTHKNAVEGGFVKAGTTVYTISDLSRVWVEAHIFEYELSSVKVGQDAEMKLPYLPGKVYTGKVAYVYPYLQQKTRDVVLRLEFENPDSELKPDMYADVKIKTGGGETGNVIPSESVIRSGERNVVFVSAGNGRFIPREVTLGPSLDKGRIQVLSGLAPGEPVVSSGQFLLDSESKLNEAVQKMMDAEKPKQEAEDDFFDDMEESEFEDDFFKDME